MPRGKSLRSQCRKMVYDVYTFMAKEAEEGVTNLKAAGKRTAAATKTSHITVKRIVNEAKNSDQVTAFRTPGKKRSRSNTVTNVDSLDKGVIKHCIHDFLVSKKKLPAVKTIDQKLRDDIGYRGSATSLRRIIKDLGFRWRTTENKKKILIEKSHIRYKRIEYLNKLKKLRQEGRPIIYTDELCVHSTPSRSKCTTESEKPWEGVNQNIFKGQRIIVVHAGSEDGFVQNALLMFSAEAKSGNYHDDIHFDNYKTWIETQLIPNLPQNAVVVIGNAPYHNKECDPSPNSNTNKLEMQSWLTEKGIYFSSDMLKPQLYQIIKQHREYHNQYSIDKILAEHNLCVLRLPPHHPELNPIEMAWAAIKRHVCSNSFDYNVSRVIDLVKEKVAQMGLNELKRLCEKSKQFEELYAKSDLIIDELTDRVIITRESSDSETSDSEDEYESYTQNSDTAEASTSGTQKLNHRFNVAHFCEGVTLMEGD